MSQNLVRVLVVDDEPITAAAHAEYVRRVDGFEVASIAHTGREAVRILRESVTDPAARTGSIDLILLDVNLPDTSGIDLCRRIRSSGLKTDVIAITAVRDVNTVREAMSLGIVLYLIKPFTFAAFADKLRGYLEFRSRFDDSAGLATQDDVDQTMAALRTRSLTQARAQLDKGMTGETLDRVSGELRSAGAAVSAAEIASRIGISRVTARRYLEYLAQQGLVQRSLRYGEPGRPELEYRRRGDDFDR